MLKKSPTARMVTADIRQPAAILDHPQVRDFIDFSRPVGLLMPEWHPDIVGQVKRNSTYYGFVGGVARKPS
jgi:hypothetical protein